MKKFLIYTALTLFCIAWFIAMAILHQEIAAVTTKITEFILFIF